MRLIARILGSLSLLAALLLLALAGWGWAQGRGFVLEPLGKVWFDLHPGSLNLSQAVVERYLWPPLWTSGIQPLLAQPAAPLLAVLAVVLLWLGRRRSHRRSFH